MRQLWKDYNLSIVLFALFMVSWLIQTVTGWQEFIADQHAHGQAAQIFGSDGYVWPWAQATFENWQSEFLQLFSFVILTAFLIHRGSHESKDSDERLQAQLDRIEQTIQRIEQGQQRAQEPTAERARAS